MKRHQKGATLLLTLIILAGLLLSMVALMRSSSTSTTISGNLAFKDAAMHEAFVGLNQALAAIKLCSVNCAFINTTQKTDAELLDNATWSSSNVQTLPASGSGYKIQYLVDRFSSTALTNVYSSEEVESFSLGFIAYDQSSMNNFSENGKNSILSTPSIFYRITVRVEGPNKTLYIAQGTTTIAVN